MLSKPQQNVVLPDGLRYRAFLSYSSADRPLALRIVRKLEAYKTPRALVGKPGKRGEVSPRIGLICQDQQEFPTSAYLSDVIGEKLSQSQMLIVLCTPNSASDQSWVNREIELFRERRPGAEIHAIIGAGEPPHCFPAALRGASQPLAADIRAEGGGFEKAMVRTIAGLLGVDFDDLWQREVRRRREQVARTAGLVALALFGILYAFNVVELQRWRNLVATEAANVWRAGGTLDAIPLAIGASIDSGNVVFGTSDAAERALQLVPGLALEEDLGLLAEAPRVSANGAQMLLVDLQRRAVVRSSATGQSTDIGILAEEYGVGYFSDDGGWITGRDAQQVGFALELSSGQRQTFSNVRVAPSISPNGHFAGLYYENRDGAIVDLNERSTGHIPQTGRPEFGPASRHMVVTRTVQQMGFISSEEYFAIDVQTGAATRFGELTGNLQFSRDERYAAAEGQETARVFDLVRGDSIELGPSGGFGGGLNISPDGRYVGYTRPDGQGFIVNLRTANITQLGALKGAATFSPDGRYAGFVLANDEGVVMNIESGERDSIGNLRTPPRFNEDGSVFVALALDGTTFVQTMDGTRTSLGLIGFSDDPEFFDSHRLATFDNFRSGFIIDASRAAGADGSPSAVASRWCGSEGIGDRIRPFGTFMRAPPDATSPETEERQRRRQAVSRFLVGRPWNPCDWRGIGAVFPNAERGDGWFEGLGQWIRLVTVRTFGARDYECADTTSGANDERRAARSRACIAAGVPAPEA